MKSSKKDSYGSNDTTERKGNIPGAGADQEEYVDRGRKLFYFRFRSRTASGRFGNSAMVTGKEFQQRLDWLEKRMSFLVVWYFLYGLTTGIVLTLLVNKLW